MREESEEFCGTCGNRRYEGGWWVCGCEISEAYGLPTMWDDSCEEWCEE